jgi:hypothetical protein
MAKIKGVALLSRLDALKNLFGDAAVTDVLSKMSESNRELLTGGGLISSSWYPAEVFKELHEATSKTFRFKDPRALEKIGEYSAEQGLTTIHRMKIKENRPGMTLQRVPPLWSAFHDTGEVTVTTEEKKAVLQVRGYALPHREFCLTQLGWVRKLAELSNAKNVSTVESKCVCQGNDYCEITVTWE